MFAFAAAALALLPAGEWLAMPMPAGFVTGYTQTAANGSIEERVPRGETVEQWTRMVTILALGNIAPETFTTNLAERWKSSCPGGAAAPIRLTLAEGRSSVETRMDCPRNPATGLPETMFLRAFRSGVTLYVIQVAFRRAADIGDASWARTQLATATLCTARSPQPICRAAH